MSALLCRIVGVGDIAWFEERSELCLVHSLAAVFHRHLYIILGLVGIDVNASAVRRKAACVLGNGVEHEERQHLVCFDDAVGWRNVEPDAVEFVFDVATAERVEQDLKFEALYAQHYLALLQFHPIGKPLVGLLDRRRQLTDVLVTEVALLVGLLVGRKHLHLM